MLLQTKFLAPAYNPKSVTRQRLMARLQPRSARKLMLISAPAGFGKTTLVSQWLHNQDTSFCWLSLDENDDDLKRFWRYLIGTIATEIKHFGGEAIPLLESESQPEAAVTAIVNELAESGISGKRLAIVLDDFHFIRSHAVLRTFAYFIDFLPPNVEIIVTTRFEPALPIARWRVKNWVDAFYSSDLVFTYDESRSFFKDYMGLSLSDQQIKLIHNRTEGWIAAMQLTALSASSKTEAQQISLSPDELMSDERHFADYITYEILEQQPAEIRQFLMDTACLLRLNADLCNHLRDADDSQEILEHLMNSNLFVVPLDKDNLWFRYHEMFRDAILGHVRHEAPETLIPNQKKAIDWLIGNNQPHEAIEQVLQLEDWDLLARLLEENGNNLIHEGHHPLVLNWLAALPDSMVDQSPRLLMLEVWALFFSNKIEIIPPVLDRLEQLIDTQRLDNVQAEPSELIDLHSEISLIRSYLARSHSDLGGATELTRQVLDQLENTNMPLKSVTYYGIGLDSFTVGDLESAEEALVSAIHHGKQEKKYTTVLSSSGLLGWIYFYQGKLELALATGIKNEQWNVHYHDPSQPRVISCWQNTILAMIYMEMMEHTIAESYINPLLKHLESGTEPGLHILIQYTRARYLFCKQLYADAIACLDDALHIYQHKKESIVFEPPSLSAFKARCLLKMGQIQKARHIIDELDSETITAIPLNFEDINLTKARIYQAQGALELADQMLSRLITQSREKSHIYHLIQALVVKSMVKLDRGLKDEAQRAIIEAVLLASQDGILSLFCNESEDIRKVIALCNDPNIPDVYLSKLIDALGIHEQPAPQSQRELPGAAALERNVQLLEPLSQRELEVLRLIDQGLANKEIAKKLSLAPATVKAHIRNLYGKIGAKSRTEALSKARQAGLI